MSARGARPACEGPGLASSTTSGSMRTPRSVAVLARPAGGHAAAITAATTAISMATDSEALPREDGRAQRDEPIGHRAPRRHDVADLRLQLPRRRHLQRRRAAQALRPHAARPEEARCGERAVVGLRPLPRRLPRQQRAEDQRETPVEPRRRHREDRDQNHRASRRPRQPRQPHDGPRHRSRRRQDVSGDDDQRHLHREGHQLPEPLAPGVDDSRAAPRPRRRAPGPARAASPAARRRRRPEASSRPRR